LFLHTSDFVQAQIFGGLVAYGFAHGASTYGFTIAPWKAIFVFTGVLTSIVGIVFFLIMPDNQLNARFLTKEERVLAVYRIKINEQGIGNKHFKWYQMKEAFMDPMVWAFVFYALVADIPNGGISNFFSQLIVSFGYSPEQSLLYGTPGGAVEVISLLLCGYLGDRLGNRLLVCTSGLVVAIVGVILIVAIPLDMPAGRLVGYYFTQVCLCLLELGAFSDQILTK
jgi:MFS transporter, ACS family, allantoate permease